MYWMVTGKVEVERYRKTTDDGRILFDNYREDIKYISTAENKLDAMEEFENATERKPGLHFVRWINISISEAPPEFVNRCMRAPQLVTVPTVTPTELKRQEKRRENIMRAEIAIQKERSR